MPKTNKNYERKSGIEQNRILPTTSKNRGINLDTPPVIFFQYPKIQIPKKNNNNNQKQTKPGNLNQHEQAKKSIRQTTFEHIKINAKA